MLTSEQITRPPRNPRMLTTSTTHVFFCLSGGYVSWMAVITVSNSANWTKTTTQNSIIYSRVRYLQNSIIFSRVIYLQNSIIYSRVIYLQNSIIYSRVRYLKQTFTQERYQLLCTLSLVLDSTLNIIDYKEMQVLIWLSNSSWVISIKMDFEEKCF